MATSTKPLTTKDMAGAEIVNEHTGEKWVYSPIVKDHFFNPRNLLLEDPKEGEFDAIGMVGSPACLAPDTVIPTLEGMKIIDDVRVGDRVLSHDGKAHSVDRRYRPKIEEQCYRITTKLGSIVVTGDHLIQSKQLPKTDTYRRYAYKQRIPTAWNHAAELEPRDICVYPFPKETKSVRYLDLLPIVRGKWDFRSRVIPTRLSVEADLLELFGYFVAEGYTKDTETGFVFSAKELAYGERVRSLVHRYFGLNATLRVRSSRLDVHVYNVHLASFLRATFGDGAAMKRIPAWFLYLPIDVQCGFIRGVWRGDGYVNLSRTNPRAGFTTISNDLVHQLKFMLLRQRIVPSSYEEEAYTQGGTNHKRSYRLHIGDLTSLERLCDILGIPFAWPKRRTAKWVWTDDHAVYVPITSVERVEQPSERLRNVEVPGPHTYLTDAFAVHNCGDVMKIWIKVDRPNDRITDLKWQTFGCGSAIASTSMFSVMVTESGGMAIDDALKIKPQHVMERLAGLPNRKIHCSVLADKAFRKAVNEYFRVSGQHERVIVEGSKVVDKRLNITDHDIEEAVLEGAQTLEEVQKKLKVGVGDPESIPEIEQLIRFYKEKYFG